jgi:hypothetical protein
MLGSSLTASSSRRVYTQTRTVVNVYFSLIFDPLLLYAVSYYACLFAISDYYGLWFLPAERFSRVVGHSDRVVGQMNLSN